MRRIEVALDQLAKIGARLSDHGILQIRAELGIEFLVGIIRGDGAQLQPLAEKVLDEALRLNPNSAEAHNNLGLVLFASGKEEEGVREFSTALRLKPNLAVARDSLERARAQIEARQNR